MRSICKKTLTIAFQGQHNTFGTSLSSSISIQHHFNWMYLHSMPLASTSSTSSTMTLRSLERQHSIGHSTYTPMFNMITYLTPPFIHQHINPRTYAERLRLSHRYHPPLLKGRFTGYLDGTHCPTWCWKSRGEDPKSHYSHKFKGPGLTQQVLMLPDLTVGKYWNKGGGEGEKNINTYKKTGWASHSDGAATHNKSKVRESTLYNEPWLDHRDLFSTDCIYAGLPQIEAPLTRQELLEHPDLHQYARQVYDFHRSIERYFREVKRKFQILDGYRYQKQFFNRLFKLTLALTNIERRVSTKEIPPMERFPLVECFNGSLVDIFAFNTDEEGRFADFELF